MPYHNYLIMILYIYMHIISIKVLMFLDHPPP